MLVQIMAEIEFGFVFLEIGPWRIGEGNEMIIFQADNLGGAW
jgi:hypothetical protein